MYDASNTPMILPVSCSSSAKWLQNKKLKMMSATFPLFLRNNKKWKKKKERWLKGSHTLTLPIGKFGQISSLQHFLLDAFFLQLLAQGTLSLSSLEFFLSFHINQNLFLFPFFFSFLPSFLPSNAPHLLPCEWKACPLGSGKFQQHLLPSCQGVCRKRKG